MSRSAGRRVILGVRPDDLHPASERPDLPAITALLQLVEALGSRSIAYFKVDARTFRPAAEDVEGDLDEEGEGVTTTRPNLVAFPAGADLRLDAELPVAVDTAHVHLFDAETGAPLH